MTSTRIPHSQPPRTPSSPSEESLFAEEIRVRGIVQGVGFRPTVYRLARALNLRGSVCNDGQGVLIQAAGTLDALHTFPQWLRQECPPLARIDSIECTPIAIEAIATCDFVIVPSVATRPQTDIAPDAATCSQCRSDSFDPHSRWYRYPFTNCTHCGPRLSIIRAIPYDRHNTSMAAFHLCSQCQQSYNDVGDRRFHAQPLACHVCGPRAWLERSDGQPIASDMFSTLDDVDAACTLLQRGEIVAIKGIGGIHLACDATNETAVQRLRQRKHRYHKPFALMARDVDMVEQYCGVTECDRALLESPAAPIVLLAPHPPTASPHPPSLAPALAPDIHTLGFMLPYTPLHHLMLKRMNRPIVLTSGNRSDEPQCIDNDDARHQLGGIAEYLLLHNRDIVNRVDDSVVRVLDGQPQVLRRARGYAPAPIALPEGFAAAPPLLAMGGELKSTFCLLRNGQAILSQHLGDLEHAAAFTAYQDTLNLYLNLFEHQPTAIAIDRHPEYLSSKLGREFAATLDHSEQPSSLHVIQHHHSHIAACMVDNGLPLDTPAVLGIALDGLGYGDRGSLWGGEFLLADYTGFERLAHFKPVAMPGGAQAIYQPWRNTYAHLLAAFGSEDLWSRLRRQYGDLTVLDFLEHQPHGVFTQMIEKGINTPVASSCGRLFDAVAAALGLSQERCSYEGQGAIALEARAGSFLATPRGQQDANQFAYPFVIDQRLDCSHVPILEPAPMWQALLTDLKQGVSIGAIAARFHVGLATAIATMVMGLHQQYPFRHVALTGGVFQNALLHTQVSRRLVALNFRVLTHHHVPPNDGGIALGQAAIAAALSLQGF